MEGLGIRLRVEREKRGWSQVYVAEQLGMKNSSTYANWEYDLREPSLEMVLEIAKLFETTTDALLGRGDTLIEVDNSKTLQLMNLIKGLTIEQQEAVYSLIKAFK